MKKRLKSIIKEFGKDALFYPDDLAATMRERGIAEKDVLTVQMILKCCPSVAGILVTGNASQAEINILIRSAAQKTGLSISSVRYGLGMLMDACGFDVSWAPYIISREKKAHHEIMPVTIEEGETLEQLQERLSRSPNSAEVLSDLNSLAEQGNVDANYKLGKHFKFMDEFYNTENGLVYFKRAAELGYGPANGAIADYMLRREHKSMEKIAALFRNPTSLSGSDGREWTKLSAMVLNYQHDNKVRQRTALIRQLIFLAMFFACLIISGGVPSTGGIYIGSAITVQVASLVWSVFSMWFRPYASVKYAYFSMSLSWFLLILGIF